MWNPELNASAIVKSSRLLTNKVNAVNRTVRRRLQLPMRPQSRTAVPPHHAQTAMCVRDNQIYKTHEEIYARQHQNSCNSTVHVSTHIVATIFIYQYSYTFRPRNIICFRQILKERRIPLTGKEILYLTQHIGNFCFFCITLQMQMFTIGVTP